MAKKSLITSLIGNSSYLVRKPDSAFDYIPFNIYKYGTTFTTGNWDVSSLTPTGKAYYVSTSGNDSNDGLGWATAYRSIWQAASQADVVIIYVAAGRYNWANCLRDVTGYEPSIIGVGGMVINSNNLAIIGYTAADNHYTKAGVTDAIGSVLDAGVLDSNDDYTIYTLKTSEAEVDATAGSYYKDGSNNLFVHTVDEREPDTNILVMKNNATVAIQSNNKNVYFENIDFESGAGAGQRFIWFRNSSSDGGLNFYAKNCSFKYNFGSYDSVDIDGCSNVIFQGCEVAKFLADGFNYHSLNSVVPNVIEINCTARNGGTDGTNQGSTIHDAGNIVRINGEYKKTTGQNIADVGASQAWLLGTQMNNGTSGYYLGNSGGNAWLQNCILSDHSAYGLINEVGTTIYTRNIVNLTTNSIGGTLAAY